MKLLCLSDIHIDRNSQSLNRDLLPEFITFLNMNDADAVLISGDISTGYQNSIRILNELSVQVHKKIYFIPGNHDLYAGKESFWKAYHSLKNHPCCISNEIIPLNSEFVLVGDVGWYDYSLGTPTSDFTIYEDKKKRLWCDEKHVNSPSSDQETTTYFLSQWRDQLDKLHDYQIIFCNHFVPWRNFTIHKEGDEKWNFFTGFLGSSRIGDFIEQYDQIKYTTFGHTHNRFGIVSDFINPTVICSPLGEFKDWQTNDFLAELKDSAVLLEI
jgi:putative phosphoesterase